jgi:YesN/AraC family two-component response regulator
MVPTRVLCVDDEPGIIESFPRILEGQGFSCVCANTVADAIKEISANHFDVLISDLNIGQPGDGFTVVSAMRRTQPDCVCFILTGYPGFESALQAIRSQVDDYLIKPMHPEQLIATIKNKIGNGAMNRAAHPNKRIADLLRENSFDITRRAVAFAKADPELSRLTLSDEDRVDHIPAILGQLAQMLEVSEQSASGPTRAGAESGEQRKRQGYSTPLLVRDAKMLQSAIYEVARENLLSLNLSYLMSDLKRLNESICSQLEYAIGAYSEYMTPGTMYSG